MRIGVIGCGNMGGGMAAHLLDNEKEVHCFDPNPDVLARLEPLGGIKAGSAPDLAAKCGLIILSLPNAAVVRGVMAEITPHLQEGSVVLARYGIRCTGSVRVESGPVIRSIDATSVSLSDSPVDNIGNINSS